MEALALVDLVCLLGTNSLQHQGSAKCVLLVRSQRLQLFSVTVSGARCIYVMPCMLVER
jgi:hypothetical protein